MYWEWQSGRPRLREILPADPDITLHQGNTEDITQIRRTSLDESSRMLGVYLNPMGDFGHHEKVLKKKADDYATRLASSKLTTRDIRIFHRSILVPAMRYSLPAVAIDEEALGTVQNRILRVMLQKMHVNGNLPKDDEQLIVDNLAATSNTNTTMPSTDIDDSPLTMTRTWEDVFGRLDQWDWSTNFGRST
jgi:hypothetical protein